MVRFTQPFLNRVGGWNTVFGDIPANNSEADYTLASAGNRLKFSVLFIKTGMWYKFVVSYQSDMLF
ncbi:hypothetical protein ACJVDH_07610 [Pedobacter sp. AW1-32]|uniref:hypothetical protein n=1 Tax=Pedobacter sp. AW1-32 TaxID=3383026 RepID=UPI003FEEBCB3